GPRQAMFMPSIRPLALSVRVAAFDLFQTDAGNTQSRLLCRVASDRVRKTLARIGTPKKPPLCSHRTGRVECRQQHVLAEGLFRTADESLRMATSAAASTGCYHLLRLHRRKRISLRPRHAPLIDGRSAEPPRSSDRRTHFIDWECLRLHIV